MKVAELPSRSHIQPAPRLATDHAREDALRQRHVRAPKAHTDNQSAEAACLRKDEVASNEHCQAGHEDRARAHPIAECPGGVRQRDVDQVEQSEGQGRHRFGQPDLHPLEDQEGLGETRQRKEEADGEQPLRFLVQLSEADEQWRALERREVLLGFA